MGITYPWTEINDYVIVKEASNIQVMDVRLYRETRQISDHFLLKTKILLPFKHTNQKLGWTKGIISKAQNMQVLDTFIEKDSIKN